MRTFVDTQGRPWVLRITVATVRRVRGVVDLCEPDQWLDEVYRDPCRLCEIAHAIASPNNGLNLTDLEEVLQGEEIAKLRAMLLEELIDFFQDRTGRGELLTAMVAMTNATIQQETQKAVSEIMKTSTAS